MTNDVSIGADRGPMSPCISVCALDDEGYCSGCLRTRQEIAGWLQMSPSQQRALISELVGRRRTRRGGIG